ncbi:MAG: class I adenylate-forming enzyme family protein [Deltaproteobacteria bacterium]
MKFDVRRLLTEHAERLGPKPALIFQEETVAFSQLARTVFGLADGFLKRGVRKGDRVAIYLPNRPEYVYCYLALFSIGATVVPLDFMLKAEELEAILGHAQASLLIAAARGDLDFGALRARLADLKDLILLGAPQEGGEDLARLLTACADAPQVPIDETDPALILYTSGSTGRPKGVCLSYRHLDAAPQAMEYFVDLSAQDVKLSALPLSHAGGLVYLQNCVYFGITLVMMERFNPLEFLRLIEKHKVTCFHMVPSMYYALLHLKEFEKYDLSSLRWVNVFGAPNSPEAIRRFKTFCPNAKLLNGWGLTETNAPNTVIPMGSDRIESIGRPAPWITLKLVDDEGREVPEGDIGELTIKSWVVMDGYYKDPAMTAEVLRDGWFHTGDLARRDAEGLYYIVGRKKDMIKVSGQLVFPYEIEEVLHKHPAVKEAAVVGVADALRGEAIKAFIVPREGAAVAEPEIRQFCRERLAHFKLPQAVAVVGTLPKTRTGKVDKNALKGIAET